MAHLPMVLQVLVYLSIQHSQTRYPGVYDVYEIDHACLEQSVQEVFLSQPLHRLLLLVSSRVQETLWHCRPANKKICKNFASSIVLISYYRKTKWNMVVHGTMLRRGCAAIGGSGCGGWNTPPFMNEFANPVLHSFGKNWAVWVWTELSNWFIWIKTKREFNYKTWFFKKSGEYLENVLYRVVAGNLKIKNSPTTHIIRVGFWERSYVKTVVVVETVVVGGLDQFQSLSTEVVIWFDLSQNGVNAISETLDFKLFPGKYAPRAP
jgi:hypothetical protein